MPAFAIFGIVSIPEPKTIAFGGVATGNMNAQLAASVTGTRSTTGSYPASIAIAPTTGMNVAVVPILLVSSVRKIISVETMITSRAIGSRPTSCKFPPSHVASPVRDTAAASVSPPPKSKRMDHGRSSMCFQRISSGSCMSPLGIRKSQIPAAMAMPESSSAARPGSFASTGRKIQVNASATKIIARGPRLTYRSLL